MQNDFEVNNMHYKSFHIYIFYTSVLNYHPSIYLGHELKSINYKQCFFNEENSALIDIGHYASKILVMIDSQIPSYNHAR